jgi:hypothetical protein
MQKMCFGSQYALARNVSRQPPSYDELILLKSSHYFIDNSDIYLSHKPILSATVDVGLHLFSDVSSRSVRNELDPAL